MAIELFIKMNSIFYESNKRSNKAGLINSYAYRSLYHIVRYPLIRHWRLLSHFLACAQCEYPVSITDADNLTEKNIYPVNVGTEIK